MINIYLYFKNILYMQLKLFNKLVNGLKMIKSCIFKST